MPKIFYAEFTKRTGGCNDTIWSGIPRIGGYPTHFISPHTQFILQNHRTHAIIKTQIKHSEIFQVQRHLARFPSMFEEKEILFFYTIYGKLRRQYMSKKQHIVPLKELNL